MTVCGLWLGLAAPPASAAGGRGPGTSRALDDVVDDAVELSSVTMRAGAGRPGVASAEVCGTHNWYYRIYLRGSGQTLFRWAFRTDYCYFPNAYWFVFTPTDRVELRHTSIRGNTVAGKIYAPNGIDGALLNLYEGATFQFCPNGTCTQSFTPRLGWAYALDGARVYVGNVPLR